MRPKGFHHSEETKKKISESHKGNKYHLGKHLSEEAKKKISEAHKGKYSGENNPNWKGGKVERKCIVCGKTFYVKQKVVRKGGGLFCSYKCAGIWRSQHKKGENSPLWKGGLDIAYARKRAKRRQLGFIPLNKPFEGAEAHHIDENFVIYIPKEIHQNIRHSVWKQQNMDEINAIAWNYI